MPAVLAGAYGLLYQRLIPVLVRIRIKWNGVTFAHPVLASDEQAGPAPTSDRDVCRAVLVTVDMPTMERQSHETYPLSAQNGIILAERASPVMRQVFEFCQDEQIVI